MRTEPGRRESPPARLRALGVLIAGLTLVRVAWASALGLGNDEAYYSLFTTRLDWAYYDHPPMVALVEACGQVVLGAVLPPALVLRSGFILLFAGSTWLLARLTRRAFGAPAGWIAALILNACGYFGTAVGTFALPDGPLLFFWLATLDRLLDAQRRPGRLGPWLGVGLAWGAAMLSKYHAVFLPAGFLLLVVWDRAARRMLATPGPYLAGAIGLAMFAPVIAWNAAHGWSSFAFQADRAVGRAGFRPDLLLAFVAGQAAYLTPWMWGFLLAAAARRRRVPVDPVSRPAQRLLLCQAVAPLAVFLVVSCARPVLPHWSLAGFVSLMPLLGADWAAAREQRPGRVRRRLLVITALPLLGMSAFVLQARTGVLQRVGIAGWSVEAAERDPSAGLWGWDQIAAELNRRGLLSRPGTFLFTSRWYESGQLARAVRGAVPVLCYSRTGAHGFGQWSRPEDWLGHDGILVSVHRSSTEPQVFDRFFASREPLGEFTVTRGGSPVRRVRLYRFRDQIQPFPFDGR